MFLNWSKNCLPPIPENLRANDSEALSLELDDDNRQLRYEIEGLKLSLSHISQTTSIEIPDYIESLLDSISKYMNQKNLDHVRVILKVQTFHLG